MCIVNRDIDRPSITESGQKLLWYPNAEIPDFRMQTRGKYRKGYPEGAVIHYTAGRDAMNSLRYGKESGYCFFMIAEDGKVIQSFPLNEWGSHAGESSWEGLGSAVSKYLVGIEISCAGVVEGRDDFFKAWFHKTGEYFFPSEVREKNGKYFHKYTDKQEESLLKLLKWLKSNNPDVFRYDYVLGHEEVSPGRKIDPGGSLSLSLPELREYLMR